MDKPDKLNAALDLARAGFSVFPLVPNGKRPLIENWRNLATTDESVIGQWWANRPDANIGIQTDQYLVVDVDPRKGGVDTFNALALTEEFPKTARSITPSTGGHIYYRLPPHTVVRGGVDVLGPGIDIRSYGGLVAAPGSAIDGRPYVWANTNAIALAPDWLIERCKKPRARTDAAGKRVVEEDETAVELAWQWMVDHAPEADEGHRDDTGFRVAARLYDFGVAIDTCRELLAEWSMNRCHPPLDADALDRLSRSGATNRDNAIGSRHPQAPGFEPVKIEERLVLTTAQIVAIHNPAEPPPRGLHYLTMAKAVTLALANSSEPLIEGFFDCDTLAVVYGESNTGKSFIALDQDYHVASGLPWAGRAVKQGAVVYVAAEGGRGIYKRLAALKHHYGHDDVPLFVIPCPVNLRRGDADLKPLIEMIQSIERECGQKVVKVTIDTLSRAMSGGDENSPVDMGLLVAHFDALRASCKCHVTVIHHTGKDKAKGARGHSLLRAATDSEIEIAGRTITVTKQRDGATLAPMQFALMPVRVGMDPSGREVTSCYVEMRQKGQAPDWPMPMPAAGEQIKEWLVAAELHDKKSFSVAEMRDAIMVGEAQKGMSPSMSPSAVKKRVQRARDILVSWGHLREVSEDTYEFVRGTKGTIEGTISEARGTVETPL